MRVNIHSFELVVAEATPAGIAMAARAPVLEILWIQQQQATA